MNISAPTKPKRLLVVVVALLVFHLSPPTEAQVPEGALSGVVQDIRDAIEDITASLEDSADSTLFRARQQLEILVNQVEMFAENSTETLFSELGVAERQFFNDLQAQIDALRQLEQITAADAQRLTDNASHAIRALPFADTHPVVLGYTPLFISSGGVPNDDFVRVEIAGALLASHEPTLIIDNTPCERSRKIDTQLAFLCNRDMFLAEQTVEPVEGELTVYEDVEWWRVWADSKEHQYDITINVIPTALGTATLSVTMELTNERRESRTQSFRHRNAFCSGVRRPLFQFNAREGWKIDPASIESSCDRSSRSSCNGLRGVTESSFGYSCTVQNRGRCGSAFGQRIWRDARGMCSGRVRWDEIASESILAEEMLDAVELYWGRDEVITLPEGARAVRLLIDKVDGSRRVITDTESRDAWFDVVVDFQRGHVIVRPASLENAMR